MTPAARAHLQRLGLRLIAARHRAIRHLLAHSQRQAPVTAGNLKQEETPGGASRPVQMEVM